MTHVVPAAAHLDSDPTNNRRNNLRALCQRCHMLHDRPHHLAQRWITYRRRSAVGDLFLGPYLPGAGSESHRARPRPTGGRERDNGQGAPHKKAGEKRKLPVSRQARDKSAVWQPLKGRRAA